MNSAFRLSVFAIALSCTVATPVLAQDTITAAEDELAAMRSQIQTLAKRIDQLERELAETRTEEAEQAVPIAANSQIDPPTANPAAADELANSNGWSFKPRGRLMFDAGTLNAPKTTGADDGFGNEVRRARLGASGDIPGGFGYKFELDFAGNEVEAADAYLSYGDGPLEVIVGHHNNFQSLEELTSSLHTSFIERAAFTDAFGFERRIGISASYEAGIVLAQVGAFTDDFADTGTDNRGVDGRLVISPNTENTQLHFGGSLHYNDLGEEDEETIRYRQRPLVHFTSTRFLDTNTLAANSEFGIGLEAAMISGQLHAVAEGYWQNIDLPLADDSPTFFGGYAEVGYFLTKGDSRGYKGGKFDRTKPINPVGKGGIGSVQLNLRYDHLDLSDAGIIGGIQNGYQASLVWKPTDYTLFSLNYGRMDYEDAVLPTAEGETDYNVDALGIRAQVDF